ncbi:hypothetical protein FHG87_010375 [Trinorchestia longiramus]|nr:hypothetical protein FHG87_010375 [Trinorchestia longiramus]
MHRITIKHVICSVNFLLLHGHVIVNLRRDINKGEKIERKVTKVIPAFHNLSYERRLQQLELITLEQRRLRGQLIATYKYLNGYNDVSLEGLVGRDDNVRTRNNGHSTIY